MNFKLVPLVSALACGAVAAAQPSAGQQEPPRQESAASTPPVQRESMQKLQQAAQRLRESIQAMAQKQPGADRDRAIAKAHQALLDTQRAMLALPPARPAPRAGAAMTQAEYEASVTQLLKAADSLRDSIIAIAREPDEQGRTRATEQAQQALWQTRLALVSAYDPGAAGVRVMGAGAQSTAGQAGTATDARQNRSAAAAGESRGTEPERPTAALVLLPLQMASSEQLADGCWVRFYDGKNFRGATLTLAGPVDMPQMYPAGVVWRDWESAVVGPKARVTTFDDENFRQRTASLAPAQRIPDLRDRKLGWFDEVHSARIACTG